MYRKLIHILLAIVLIGTATGTKLSRHFCAGELVAVSISADYLPCCSDEPDNCCVINSEWIRLALDYTSSPTYIPDFTVNTAVLLPFLFDKLSVKKQIDRFYRTASKNDYPPPLRLSTMLAKYQSYLL